MIDILIHHSFLTFSYVLGFAVAIQGPSLGLDAFNNLLPRSGTNFKIRNKPGFILAGCVVMLFQSGGSYDDIRRRANACERNIWNGPNSFEAQEIFFEYAAWSVEPCI